MRPLLSAYPVHAARRGQRRELPGLFMGLWGL